MGTYILMSWMAINGNRIDYNLGELMLYAHSRARSLRVKARQKHIACHKRLSMPRRSGSVQRHNVFARLCRFCEDLSSQIEAHQCS